MPDKISFFNTGLLFDDGPIVAMIFVLLVMIIPLVSRVLTVFRKYCKKAVIAILYFKSISAF